MKRFLFLMILILIFKLPIFAQTAYWEEDFNSPSGWSLEGNWSINASMLEFMWDPSISNFDMSAISAEITLPETAESICIRQYIEPWTFSVIDEMAEILVVSGDDENVLWSYDLSNGIWGDLNGTEIEFPIDNYGGQTVQFKFRTYGSSTYAWNWWQVFHITVVAFFDDDLGIAGIGGPTMLNLNEPGTWSVEVKNLGMNMQSDYTVQLYNYKTSEQVGNIIATDDLYVGQSAYFNFEWTPVEVTNTALYANVIMDGDEFVGNNISDSYFVRVVPEIEFNVLVWDNDNGIATVVDPEKGDLIEPDMALTRSLGAAGIAYTQENYLPDDLEQYDMIFCTLGDYCLS